MEEGLFRLPLLKQLYRRARIFGAKHTTWVLMRCSSCPALGEGIVLERLGRQKPINYSHSDLGQPQRLIAARLCNPSVDIGTSAGPQICGPNGRSVLPWLTIVYTNLQF